MDLHSKNSCGSISTATGRACWLQALTQAGISKAVIKAAYSSVPQVGLFSACLQPGSCTFLLPGLELCVCAASSSFMQRAALATSYLKEQKPHERVALRGTQRVDGISAKLLNKNPRSGEQPCKAPRWEWGCLGKVLSTWKKGVYQGNNRTHPERKVPQ